MGDLSRAGAGHPLPAGAGGVYFYETNHSTTVHPAVTPAEQPVAGQAVTPPSPTAAQTQSTAQVTAHSPAAQAHAESQQAQAQQAQAQQAQAQRVGTQQTQAQPAQSQQTQAQQGQAAANPQPAQPPAPSVDVVRMDQNGALVMAGRAQPGETLDHP